MLKGPTFGNLGEIQQIAILKRGKHIEDKPGHHEFESI